MTLVVNGPPADAAVFNSVPGAWVHLSSIAGLIHATRRAAAVVGIDSGPLHLAAALARPGVAVFGPTDPSRNGPFGGSLAVLRAPSARTTYKRRKDIDESMRAVTPSAVLEELRIQIGGSAPGGCAA
jgi:heptosyltransferase-1